MGNGVDLAVAIKALRQNLYDAIATGASGPLRFRLSPVELELQLEAVQDVNGKVGWKVLEFGGERGSTTTQSLKVTLTPIWTLPDGSETPDFRIAIEAGADERTFGPRTPPTGGE